MCRHRCFDILRNITQRPTLISGRNVPTAGGRSVAEVRSPGGFQAAPTLSNAMLASAPARTVAAPVLVKAAAASMRAGTSP